MSSFLLKNIQINDLNSSLHGQLGDLGVQEGVIKAFGIDVNEAEYQHIIEFSGCYLSPAFVDLRCNSSDPGYEYRETNQTLASSAFAGGYSQVAVLPNSLPCRQSKGDIENLKHQSQHLPVQLLPIGAICTDLKSDDLTEMYDMKQHGAVAFSNANYAIANIGTMSRALQYSKTFDGLLYSFCQETDLTQGAYVAEGPIAVSLGLKGMPQMSEYLMVQRDIELADYHQCKVHFSKISTEKSVELIRQAKAQGIAVTCDVAVMNLALTDETIMDFDSHLKLNPPLRQANDVKALWEGLRDGTIDAICSDHHPQDIERKQLEFEYAAFGAISIQIAYSIAVEGRNRFCPQLSDDVLLSKFNQGPRAVLGLSPCTIAEGQKAEFTIINPQHQTILTRRNNRSKSENTYYMDKPLPNFIEATFNGLHHVFNKNN